MKILVPIKRVIDAYVRIRIKANHSGVETQNVKMSINPFDEIAIEEALRIKEAGHAIEVVVVSIGPAICQENLRTAMALGADRAILIQHDESLEPLMIAKLLKAIALKENPELIILGKQAIDSDDNQTGQMLAALLGWAQGTFISNVKIQEQTIEVVREIDGGLETLQLKLPAVITTDLRLNQPRYASLPNIVKAKQKSLELISVDSLGVEIKNRVSILSVEPPPSRKAGIKLETVDELINQLRHEAKVI